MKTVTEFNTAVIVVSKMIHVTYKFLRGVLHMMHDGDDGDFSFWQTLIVFH